jgi:hypothetical protein
VNGTEPTFPTVIRAAVESPGSSDPGKENVYVADPLATIETVPVVNWPDVVADVADQAASVLTDPRPRTIPTDMRARTRRDIDRRVAGSGGARAGIGSVIGSGSNPCSVE